MLSLRLKTTCVVFLETFVNFLQAYVGFHFERNHDGDLYDYYCLKSKSEVFILFLLDTYMYSVHRSFFSCKAPLVPFAFGQFTVP